MRLGAGDESVVPPAQAHVGEVALQNLATIHAYRPVSHNRFPMPASPKRFRFEDSGAAIAASARPRRCEHDANAGGEPPRAVRRSLGEVAADLHAMRSAIATTRREVADLQHSPAGAEAMHRAAGELNAVSSAAEQATTRILGAVEEIELAASILRGPVSDGAREDAAAAILERVLLLYEACNFHDIAGQRIRKVVATLKFVEERLDRVIAAWDEVPPRLSARSASDEARSLLRGPSLPGDDGFVSQAEVDAYFP